MFILTRGEQEKWALVGRNRKREAQTKYLVKGEIGKILCFGQQQTVARRVRWLEAGKQGLILKHIQN